MSSTELERHAQTFVRVAERHALCNGTEILSVDDQRAVISVNIRVEMPLADAARGISDSGVKVFEEVWVSLWSNFPWSSPTFTLREDFPRGFPHLSSRSGKGRPIPCLIEGEPDEYFGQWGLVEAGIVQILSQLGVWLAKAATRSLMDPSQGWEPVLRYDLDDVLIADPRQLRGRITNKAGHLLLRSRFIQYREGQGREAVILVSDKIAPASGRVTAFPYRSEKAGGGVHTGDTVTALFWPAVGTVSNDILAENIETLDDLAARAGDLGLGTAFKTFLTLMEDHWRGRSADMIMPVGVIMCFRRPYSLIGRDSSIELLPYVFEIAPTEGRRSLVDGPDGKRVRAAKEVDRLSPELLRSISGAPDYGSVAIIGCGSVGSKTALHLARAGVSITALSDNRCLMPHNMARHALVRGPLQRPKASELADELTLLAQRPQIYLGDVSQELGLPDARLKIAPPGTATLVNTTASLIVREALSLVPKDALPSRMAEMALFGRGSGGFVLLEGAARNPSLADLEVMMSAEANPRERTLLFDPKFGLTEVQIGDGCGSLTMPSTDMRLSAMTALAAEQLVDLASAGAGEGAIAIGTHDGAGTTSWRRIVVPEMLEVPVEGGAWRLRIARHVVDRMREDIARHPEVETGGLMLGSCSARTMLITVVDLLDPPSDSSRSASLFVLGRDGLKSAIAKRYEESGKRLIDVGTWHSHLAEIGPSAIDRSTAKDLAEERPPPAVLLIVTPSSFHALMHEPASA
ncbi:Mov34/MPN/PAD-1 family protein (plasmid) [Hoeflea sp. Naph1]|uniref:Mov34/MPN/PAD-1 family protein n=1 Tax=Hoeflea sp. Naph1 TaxID=3388653 RepID=UPI00398F96E9